MPGGALPLVSPAAGLDPEELDRYSRHLLLPGFGADAQRRLKNARVVVVGAGGLGSPVLLYLAAAGVGTLGVIDDDRVEASNLQRQIIHGTSDLGRLKVDSARDALLRINPRIRVEAHPYRLTAQNALELLERYDVVVDGADNFATRYLVSDAAELSGRPCVWGSILRFGAQVSVFWAAHGPTYRDLYPDAPPRETAPSCGEAGVLGMLCGAAGSIMAAEAVKLITGTGRPLLGRLALFDLAEAGWRELTLTPDPARPAVTRFAEGDAGIPDDCALDAPESISAHELRESLRERAAGRAEFELVDVREADEFAEAHIAGARSEPLSALRTTGSLDGAPLTRRIVLYCKAGIRARAAADILRLAGHAEIAVFDGGMDVWSMQPREEEGAAPSAQGGDDACEGVLPVAVGVDPDRGGAARPQG
jgi:adenylyltransferase/sulfurtransferase